MNTRLAVAALLATLGGSAGCSEVDADFDSQRASQTASSALTIALTPGEAVHGAFIVSGASKTPPRLPSLSDWRCGGRVSTIRSYDSENFDYLEIKNQGDVAASVALSLEGQPDASLALFAYTSPNAPASIDEVNACLVASDGGFGGDRTFGPELSSRRGAGLVVPAHGSAFVMLVTSSRTGRFPVKVTTEAVEGADRVVTLTPDVGASVKKTVLVSGASKTPPELPSLSEWDCGGSVGSLRTVRSHEPETFAYIEVKNPGDVAASVALSLEGEPEMNLAFFAYTSPNAPSSLDEVKACMIAEGGDSSPTGWSRGPELSSRLGTGLVVPAHGSAFVMLATASKTGQFPLIAKTEALGPADKAAIEVPAELGATVTQDVLVSGASKTPPKLPSLSAWNCGQSVSTVRSYDPESFAYIEVKNPGDVAASVALSLDGEPEPSLAFFAYTSPNAPASIDEVKTCMVADDGELSVTGTSRGPELSSRRGTGLVVPAHGSAFVMLATMSNTGPFRLKLSRE